MKTRYATTKRARTFALFLSVALMAVLIPSTPAALAAGNQGLQIDGVDTHGVLLGSPGSLGAAQFTLELWFKRTGAGGVAQSTGSGGNTDSIPLITKGRSEGDGSNIDTNYYFGIDASSGELEADFEDMASGANHPVNGVTPVSQNVWHHGAATFNGSQFCIYLDGVLDGTCTATTAVPRSDSIQRPAIGTSLNSTNVIAGSFLGQVDEARVWNVARSQAEIQASMNAELTSGAGLIGRWGMNEGSGTTTAGSVGGINGTLTAGTSWVAGAPALDPPPVVGPNAGVQLDGVDDAINLGAGGGSPLGATNFTLELWFKQTGAGSVASTGTGGITTAIPLITKGRSESDGTNVDTNYFLGINQSTGTLAADFEDQRTSNNNNPVNGVTVITQGVWHHAAATYNGSQFCLYLDGNLDGTCTATTQTPRSDSIQIPAIGTAYDSTGTSAGRFAGQVDEARIWNVARTPAQIQGSMNSEITTATPGLLGRWGMNEGSGSTAANAAGTASVNGSLMGGATWVAGAPALDGGPPPPPSGSGLQIDGVDTHGVLLGSPGSLGAAQFTLELWFKRTGAGVLQSTGSGGNTDSIPLITKGRSENDGSNIDTNYYFGIDASSGELEADFEDMATGANHPVNGVTPVTQNVWHHGAATFNGSQFCIYLDGQLDGSCVATTAVPRSDSIQRPAIGTSTNSTGVVAGSFAGQVDEARIWNVARTQSEIQATMSSELTTGTGLIGRWGMNEGSGTTTAGSVGGINGTLTAGVTWGPGAPLGPSGDAPDMPVVVGPTDGATNVTLPPTLDVTVTDPDSANVDVTFFGRPAGGAGAGQDFTIMTIPDTQWYSENIPNTRNAIYTAQMNWIVSSKTALNTVFVTHLGDMTQNFDTVEAEWQRASANQAILDSNGVRNGVNTGNHDFANSGSSNVAHFFDQYFPPSRYQGFPWYGGYLGDPTDGIADGGFDRLNKDNYSLFSAGGMDFLIIQIEHDMPIYATTWAQAVIDAYPNRHVIISTHAFVDANGNRGNNPVSRTDGQSAQAVWTNLIVPNCEIFMVVNGHYHGSGRRTDNNSCGQPVFQLNSDYQDLPNGGDGYLRYYTFKPSEDKIYATTYSPTLNSFDSPLPVDAFTLDWDMAGAAQFTQIGTVQDVASGEHATIQWNGLDAGTAYEWYAVASDGSQSTDGPTSSFTTEVPPPTPPVVDSVTIDQATPRTNDSLSVTVTSHDVNNDPITYQYQWTKNGSPVGGNTATLNLATAGNGDKGDAIAVTVTANDGTANSVPVTSSSVTVLNTAPSATVGLSPATPRPTQTVTATATRADVDTDAVTLTYVWKLNGATVKTTTASSSLTDTLNLATTAAANGDSLSVEVTPNDGTTNGTMVSSTVTVNIPTVSAIPDSTFQVNGRVNALLRVGDRIYIGGDFTQLLGHNGEIVPRQYLAAVDANTGQPVAWDPGGDGVVYSLAASPDGTTIYAGGTFTHVGTLTRTRIAAMDASTGAVRPFNPTVSALVRSIVTLGNRVYVGGAFQTVSGQGQTSQPRARLAAFDATNGTLTTWNPNANASPRDMVVTPDGRIIVVGDFTMIGGSPSNYLASLDATTGALLPWSGHPSDAAQGVTQGPGRLFVAVGTGAAGNQVVAFDLTTGAQQWLAQGDGDVVDIAYMDGVVYAGGHFDNMSGQPRGRLAAFNPSTGALRPDWTPSVNTVVAIVTMIAGGNKLYIGGAFTLVSGVGQQRYAVFSGPPAPNTAPVMDSAVIDQAAPRTNDTLSVTLASHDDEGNAVTYAYQWTRNGVDISGATGATLDMSVANRGDKGDLIRVRVTANDGSANSNPLTSAPVTVLNTAPTATVALGNHSPGTDDVLQASVVGTDADADTVTFTYLWTVNGNVVRTTTTTALTDSLNLATAGNGDAGDAIVVTVTPNDGTANGSGVSDTATVGTGAVPPMFSDDFTSGNFSNWTSNTRLTIDNTLGSPGTPSARAQVTNQSASAFRTLNATTMSACTSMNLNRTAGGPVDAFRLRTAANGAIIKVVILANGNLQLRSDFSSTTFNSNVALGTGWHNVELCGTVGSNTTWDLYRDGVRIVNAWQADTGTTPIGRLQIGDTVAKTLTLNFDHIVMDSAPGEGGAPDTTPPTTPGQPTGNSPSAGTIQIGWAASTDASPPITYRVYRDGNPTPIGSTTATTYTDPGLTPGTSHSYTVDALDAGLHASAMSPASAQIVVSAAASAIFADDFSSGNFVNWTSNTRLTIDNAVGNPAPSARAQTSSQSASAYRDLTSPVMTACTSLSVNVSAGNGIDLFRLRTAANGAIIKVVMLATGNLQIRSDFGSTTINSGVALGTGWHSVELCGTVGSNTTWDLYRDGVRIVTAWAADTGTTAIGRIQIGDVVAKTFTVNYDNVRMDTAVGG